MKTDLSRRTCHSELIVTKKNQLHWSNWITSYTYEKATCTSQSWLSFGCPTTWPVAQHWSFFTMRQHHAKGLHCTKGLLFPCKSDLLKGGLWQGSQMKKTEDQSSQTDIKILFPESQNRHATKIFFLKACSFTRNSVWRKQNLEWLS